MTPELREALARARTASERRELTLEELRAEVVRIKRTRRFIIAGVMVSLLGTAATGFNLDEVSKHRAADARAYADQVTAERTRQGALRGAINCVGRNRSEARIVAFVAAAAQDLAGVEEVGRIVRQRARLAVPLGNCQRLPGVTPSVLREARAEVARLEQLSITRRNAESMRRNP